MTYRALLTTAVLGAALAAPAPALATKTFSGKTQQDRGASVTVGDDGVVQRVSVGWRSRRCQRGNFLQDKTDFRPPFDSATPEAFSDEGTYTLRQRGGYRIRVTITLTGKHLLDPANPAGEAWQGTIRASTVVRRNGRTIDRCPLRSIGWTATLQQ